MGQRVYTKEIDMKSVVAGSDERLAVWAYYEQGRPDDVWISSHSHGITGLTMHASAESMRALGQALMEAADALDEANAWVPCARTGCATPARAGVAACAEHLRQAEDDGWPPSGCGVDDDAGSES